MSGELFICTRCFVRYNKETTHDCSRTPEIPMDDQSLLVSADGDPILPVRNTDLNRMWDTTHPEFTPFDDRPMSKTEFAQLLRFVNESLNWRITKIEDNLDPA